MIGHNGAPRTYRTGSKRHGWQWACSISIPGETQAVCPMMGEPYLATRQIVAYGSTRLRAERAFAALVG